ncbi:MAG: polysaccharide deacetylase family protein, partial [Polaromonas sp.]|nr:polysaccharide deacetylase family protein [Polaromonas sp.]
MPEPMPGHAWKPGTLLRASAALHVLAMAAVLVDSGLWPWALAAVVLNHGLIAFAGLWPRSDWLGPNWTRLPAAAAARREIALTIDDGPDPTVTPLVLDLLDRYAARATFF